MFHCKLFLCVVCVPVVYGFLENDVSGDAALQTQVSKLVATVTDLKAQLQTSMDRITSLEAQLDSQKSSDIAFYAYMSKDLLNPAQGSTIVFDVAKTNDGGAYNPVNGVFQAPVNGSYHFQFIGASPEDADPGHAMHVFISKNGMREAYAFFDHNTNHWTQNIAAIVLHLVKGDRVWVEVGEIAGTHSLGGYRDTDKATHTHFSGFLIHSD